MNLPQSDSRNDLVYYLGRDASFHKALERRLADQRLRLRSFERPAELVAAAGQAPPALLILELGMVPKEVPAAGFVAEMVGGPGPAAPLLLCIAESDGIAPRLQSVRAGAKACFVAPVDAGELAATVSHLCNLGREPYRILLVEDEETQALYIAALLASAGMKTCTVSDPLLILDALADFRPDLILMDIYMPGANGAELTAIVRDHDQFHETPILLVSDETDPDKQLDALLLGGDGFVAKPVHRRRLVALIEHYIRLSRSQRERRAVIAKRGTPSGLLDKAYFMRTLDRAVRDAAGLSAGAAVLILGLDAPQQIMDRLGLSGMEKLMALVERRIARHLEAADAATRLGDSTYALLLRRKDRAALCTLAETLRRNIGEQGYPLGQDGMTIGASVGVGFFDPLPEDAITMAARADNAFAAARQLGGNRVEIWAPQGERSESGVKELIAHALKRDGFAILFQPIVALNQSEGMLYEAQLRLLTPNGEPLPPREILPVAMRGGLMPAIDRWVMEYALDMLHDHRVRHPDLRLLVHQTLASVCRKDWVIWLREQLHLRELTEIRPILQLQMQEVRAAPDAAAALVGLVRKIGVRTCVCNVSGAEAEIELLGRLNADLAKLALEIVVQKDVAALTDLVGRLHHRGIPVIVAGIDDQAMVTRAWSCRADFIQGSYIQIAHEEISFEAPAPHGL